MAELLAAARQCLVSTGGSDTSARPRAEAARRGRVWRPRAEAAQSELSRKAGCLRLALMARAAARCTDQRQTLMNTHLDQYSPRWAGRTTSGLLTLVGAVFGLRLRPAFPQEPSSSALRRAASLATSAATAASERPVARRATAPADGPRAAAFGSG